MSSDEDLAARLDEDEGAAKAVEDGSAPWDGQWRARDRHALETRNGWVIAVSPGPHLDLDPAAREFAPGVVEHIARHDPARALRFVDAVRDIIRESDGVGHGWAEYEPAYYAGLSFALIALAGVYED